MQYAQFGRQTRIVINNRVTDFIPNPTFERVAAPGAHEKFFAGENTEGLTLREMQGKAIDAPAATRNPEARVAELDRQGVIEALNYPTLGSLVEHSSADDPAADPGDHPRAQRVDPRALVVQLRRPGVHHADHQPVRGRRRPARTGVDRWTAAPGSR